MGDYEKVETISPFSLTKHPRIMEMSFLSGEKRRRMDARSFLFISVFSFLGSTVGSPMVLLKAVYHNIMTQILYSAVMAGSSIRERVAQDFRSVFAFGGSDVRWRSSSHPLQ